VDEGFVKAKESKDQPKTERGESMSVKGVDEEGKILTKL